MSVSHKTSRYVVLEHDLLARYVKAIKVSGLDDLKNIFESSSYSVEQKVALLSRCFSTKELDKASKFAVTNTTSLAETYSNHEVKQYLEEQKKRYCLSGSSAVFFRQKCQPCDSKDVLSQEKKDTDGPSSAKSSS